MPHIVQANIARMRAPMDDPKMAGFVERLEPLNALADASPGFVWRLQTEEGDATEVHWQLPSFSVDLDADHISGYGWTPNAALLVMVGAVEIPDVMTNEYGDFCLQVDDTVGRVMKALERNGLTENTIVVFTADNGCSPAAEFEELAQFNHNPSYVFRGHKADIFEGGHRIPFVIRWPETITAGSVSDISTPMMANTTNNSTRVNADGLRRRAEGAGFIVNTRAAHWRTIRRGTCLRDNGR